MKVITAISTALAGFSHFILFSFIWELICALEAQSPMGLQFDFEAEGCIIHDRRSVPREDDVRQQAVDIACEVMDGIKNLNDAHTLMMVSLFITDQGAKLVFITRSFEMKPLEKKLDRLLKRVTHDSATGSLYTYVVPILEKGTTEKLPPESK